MSAVISRVFCKKALLPDGVSQENPAAVRCCAGHRLKNRGNVLYMFVYAGSTVPDNAGKQENNKKNSYFLAIGGDKLRLQGYIICLKDIFVALKAGKYYI